MTEVSLHNFCLENKSRMDTQDDHWREAWIVIMRQERAKSRGCGCGGGGDDDDDKLYIC
jgi:hypothetical protein